MSKNSAPSGIFILGYHLTRQYGLIAGQVAASIVGLKKSDILISKNAISHAFAEAATDLEIMSLRRKPKNGISLSKIAGIVAFRLARFAPLISPAPPWKMM